MLRAALGRKGFENLDFVAGAECVSAHMPGKADVVLLDTATHSVSAEATEKMVRMSLRLSSSPLVVAVSNTLNCLQEGDPHARAVTKCEACVRCVGQGVVNQNESCSELYGGGVSYSTAQTLSTLFHAAGWLGLDAAHPTWHGRRTCYYTQL